jgi:C-terminal binding protein
MPDLPKVVVTDFITEPLTFERDVLDGAADVIAVIDALASAHLAGAGIDVLEQEPPPENAPILQAWCDPSHPAHDRLLLNPHAAYYCEEGEQEFRTKGAQEILRALTNQALRNQVN